MCVTWPNVNKVIFILHGKKCLCKNTWGLYFNLIQLQWGGNLLNVYKIYFKNNAHLWDPTILIYQSTSECTVSMALPVTYLIVLYEWKIVWSWMCTTALLFSIVKKQLSNLNLFKITVSFVIVIEDKSIATGPAFITNWFVCHNSSLHT